MSETSAKAPGAVPNPLYLENAEDAQARLLGEVVGLLERILAAQVQLGELLYHCGPHTYEKQLREEIEELRRIGADGRQGK